MRRMATAAAAATAALAVLVSPLRNISISNNNNILSTRVRALAVFTVPSTTSSFGRNHNRFYYHHQHQQQQQQRAFHPTPCFQSSSSNTDYTQEETTTSGLHPTLLLSPRQQILDRFEAGHSTPRRTATNTKTKTTTTTISQIIQPHNEAIEDGPNNESTTTTNTATTTTRIEESIIEVERRVLVNTLDWLEGVVIGYNLCPFAEAPMMRNELAIEVVRGTDTTTILGAILGEALRLGRRNRNRTNNNNSTAAVRGTSLVVCPDLCPTNFLGFLEVYNVLVEGVLPDHDLQDDVQIAPFHPFFVFDNENENDNPNEDNTASIDNYTNRSPYPIFHVLREAEVETAVDALHGNAEKVWKRNVDLLRAMEDIFLEQPQPATTSGASTLLRSFFLKGQAHRCSSSSSAADGSELNHRSPGHCPIETIEHYRNQIRLLLKEFRTKDY